MYETLGPSAKALTLGERLAAILFDFGTPKDYAGVRFARVQKGKHYVLS